MSEEKDVVAEQSAPVESPVDETEDLELEDLDFESDDESTDEEESLTEDEPEPEEESKDQSEEDEGKEPGENTESEESEEDTQNGEEDASPEPTPEELRKQYNDEQAKRRIAEKQLKLEKEKREQEILKTYLEEAKDDDDLLKQRQLEVERHYLEKERISIATEKLEVGIQRAMATIDLLQDGSPEEKEALAQALDDYDAMYVVRDKDGNIQQVNKDVTEFLQAKADSIKALTRIGAKQQAKQKSSQKSKTLTPPSKTPKQVKEDPDLSDFDSEWE